MAKTLLSFSTRMGDVIEIKDDGETILIKKRINEEDVKKSIIEEREGEHEDKHINDLNDLSYRLIENTLNRFKNKEIGYSQAINCIQGKYEQLISDIIFQQKIEIIKKLPSEENYLGGDEYDCGFRNCLRIVKKIIVKK